MNGLIQLDLSEAKNAVMAERNTIRPAAKRAHEAAIVSRFNPEWGTSNLSADIDLLADIPRLRGRARRLAQNNPHAKKYLRIVQKNIVGPDGITMRAKIPMKKGKKLNEKLNTQIEKAWARWGRKENCTVAGNKTWAESQRFGVLGEARDGEAFVRLVNLAGNPFNFALQFLDPDQLDTNYNDYQMQNGNVIRMGVETDAYGRAVAYHFWQRHPSEYFPATGSNRRIRIPATEIVHLVDPDRVMQSRGVTRMAPSMLTMYSLNRYKDAEILAATFAAAKGGFIESKDGAEGYTGPRDEKQRVVMTAEMGTIEQLPANTTFNQLRTEHPPTAYEAFVQSAKRDIGAGLDVSYESLANDRKGVNYSSIRAGLLDDRDTWRILQDWTISTFCRPIFERWFQQAWLSGIIELPAGDVPADYYEYFDWHPRGFAWVDPLKDMQATLLAIQNGLFTQTESMAESGNDFEETMRTRKYEQDFIAELGIKVGTDYKGVADTASDDQKVDPNAQGEN